MRKFGLLLVMLLCTLVTYAVPADNVIITHTQKDGTVLTLRLVGDEHMHYYLNVATGKAMRQDADGDFVVISDEELSANRESASQRRSAANARRRSRLLGPAKVGTMGTMTGQKKGVVILVNFADKAMTTGTQAKFDNMFNQLSYNQDGHIGSVADYFKAQSYGQFELSFDVVGPVTLSQNMAYYGGNNSNGHDSRPGEMAREACVLADGLGVDFSKYDWDNDGYVDQVFVIYAGYGENYSGADENTIWPHEWDLVSAGTTVYNVDGVKVKTYACCAELYGISGTTLNGMGTACHEFSHCLGYPDTYDIDYSGGVGMDSYDIMCRGSYNGPNRRGEVPAGFTAYERWMAGWLTPTELSSAANVTDMKDLGTEGEAYVIYNNSNKNEYFLLENRQSSNWFRYYDSNTAGHGLFITHVDFNQTVWNYNAPNDDPNHQRMTWVPADKNYGTYDSSSKSWNVSSNEQKGDYFPGTSNVTSFKPTASAWNTTGGKWFTSESGSNYTNHELSEITENTTAGTISFLFDGGVIDDGSRYTITLDACGGSVSQNKWTQTAYKEAWTLPEPVPTVNGWYGAGWSLTKINSNTLLDNVDLIDYDRPYEPESDVTLYAVYHNEDFICNSYPITPDPETGDGGDEPGEGEGDDITITPISGIPAGYYNSTIVGKNNRELELALKAIVNPHTAISYSSLWKAYETTDVVPTALLKDPAKTDQVYDMYANLNTFTKYYSDKDHTQTGGINREHCVPNSWWGGKTGNATAYTDLHHLVPSDGAANNAKSNHPLGEYQSGMTLSWPTETKTNTNGYTYVEADNTADHSGSWSHVWNTTSGTKVFEPADEFKGDFARMYLYVICAYEGDLTWQTADNTMFSNGANNYTVIANDAKALLLKWHRQDPVSDKERLRNNAVQSIQGNRNPFIDYPVLVEYVWGDKTTETTFSLETMPSSYQFGVTYCVGQDVTCSETVHLCDRGSAITLPTATTTVNGWNFCGWTTSAIANTTTAPSPLLTGNYTPSADVSLYAVFQANDTYSITPDPLAPETPDSPDTPGTTALYFPHIARLGQPFTAPAFNTNSDGAQTWTSSNTAVATVDNEGHITIHGVGTTIITVTQAETAAYKQGTASYMIKVVE